MSVTFSLHTRCCGSRRGRPCVRAVWAWFPFVKSLFAHCMPRHRLNWMTSFLPWVLWFYLNCIIFKLGLCNCPKLSSQRRCQCSSVRVLRWPAAKQYRTKSRNLIASGVAVWISPISSSCYHRSLVLKDHRRYFCSATQQRLVPTSLRTPIKVRHFHNSMLNFSCRNLL